MLQVLDWINMKSVYQRVCDVRAIGTRRNYNARKCAQDFIESANQHIPGVSDIYFTSISNVIAWSYYGGKSCHSMGEEIYLY